MCTVVGPVGFTGGEPLPARATWGYLGLNGAAMSMHGSAGQADGVAEQVSAETAMMDRFVSDYLQLMDGRIETIRDYVERLRYEEARVAILSLESASGMVGETTLRSILHDLRLCVDTCSPERKLDLLAQVVAEADRVYARLSPATD